MLILDGFGEDLVLAPSSCITEMVGDIIGKQGFRLPTHTQSQKNSQKMVPPPPIFFAAHFEDGIFFMLSYEKPSIGCLSITLSFHFHSGARRGRRVGNRDVGTSLQGGGMYVWVYLSRIRDTI